jgi:hypothetical protein
MQRKAEKGPVMDPSDPMVYRNVDMDRFRPKMDSALVSQGYFLNMEWSTLGGEGEDLKGVANKRWCFKFYNFGLHFLKENHAYPFFVVKDMKILKV